MEEYGRYRYLFSSIFYKGTSIQCCRSGSGCIGSVNVNDVNVPSKSNKHKNSKKILSGGALKVMTKIHVPYPVQLYSMLIENSRTLAYHKGISLAKQTCFGHVS